MVLTVEREEEFGLFVLVDVDGSDEVGPLAVDVVETSDIAAALVDQIELVAVAYANLILRLTVGREAVARIDQGDDDGRFAQLEFLSATTSSVRIKTHLVRQQNQSKPKINVSILSNEIVDWDVDVVSITSTSSAITGSLFWLWVSKTRHLIS